MRWEELHRQLMYNPWTGDFYWKVSLNQSIKIGSIAGSLNNKNYIIIGIKNEQYLAHRLAWFYVHGYMPENDIDHKDRIRHHNWILNLRQVSDQCNQRNTGNRKDNISGVKGVWWDGNANRWKCQITVNKKQKYLGLYEDFDEAVCVRLAGEQCLDWSGCDNSSPAYLYVKENIQWWI